MSNKKGKKKTSRSWSLHILISAIFLYNDFHSVVIQKLNLYPLFTITFSPFRRFLSFSWSRTAPEPARHTCPVWPVCPTSHVAGARLCPAACCGTAQTSALRMRRRKKVNAICCWHPSTAPCVKSTETAPLVLGYITDNTEL